MHRRAWVALSLGLIFLLVVFVVHPLLIRGRTGHSVWVRGFGATSWEKFANLLFVVGCGLDLANPLFVIITGRSPRAAAPMAGPEVAAAALGLYGVGLVLAVGAQLVMGESWRTSIDPQRRTALVTDGPFRLIRNPT